VVMSFGPSINGLVDRSPMTEQQRRERRAKLAALAERGVDGERETARRKLAEFDARYPPPVGGDHPPQGVDWNAFLDIVANAFVEAVIAHDERLRAGSRIHRRKAKPVTRAQRRNKR